MADVLNRKTLSYLISVDTPEYDTAEWLINPDLTQVAGVLPIYWKIVDDQVVPMSADEQRQAGRLVPYGGVNDLAAVIAAKIVMINSVRDQNLSEGWSFNGVVFDSDAVSTLNIAGTQTLVNSGYTLPTDFTWRTKDNSNQPFNNAMFLHFFTAGTMWREAVYRGSWMHKANVSGMTSVDAVIDYDLTKGWAKGYTYDDTNGYQVVF